MITLRPYQENLINDTREALKRNRSVLLTSPTGSGKTALTVFMMGEAAGRGKRAWFIVHQKELLQQTSGALWHQKLEHGVVAAGRVLSTLRVQVCSVQSLINRLGKLEGPDLIIIDEAHRSAAASYQLILEAYPNAVVVGLTATPQRTDGKGLDNLFSEIVSGPTIRQLIDAGFLCDYEVYAPKLNFDLSDVKIQMGDYKKDQLEHAIDKPMITGDAVNHYKKLANGKRCVVMCVSINHAEHVKQQYLEQGVPAANIDGKMASAARAQVIEDFKSGKVLVLCNVQLLIEGVDIPNIEVVQWLRPTQSLIVFMQGNGRGLRPCDGKEKLIILDHVGNVERHGLPCEDREWTLEGKKKGKRAKQDDEPDVKIQICHSCYQAFKPGHENCPNCGAPLKKERAQLEVVEGDLHKIDINIVRMKRKKEQGSARTLEDLVALGVARGMKKAPQWAVITHCSREKRKPTSADFNEALKIYRGMK